MARGETVSVGKDLDCIVAGSKGGVYIPIYTYAQLLVGIFHLSVGSGSYGLSVNCERASTFKQESLRLSIRMKKSFMPGAAVLLGLTIKLTPS